MIDPSCAVIRPGRLEDAGALNELTKRSVMYWGYEPAFLEWEPEAITVDHSFMGRASTFVLEESSVLAGYYALVVQDRGLSLDKLFIDPPWIGRGYGRLLWDHAIAEAGRLGFSSITLLADPNAAPFYTKVGARFIEEIPTSWPGWKLHSFIHEF